MSAWPFLLVGGGVFLIAALVILYALWRNVDIKACCKIPFAMFSVEAKHRPGLAARPANGRPGKE
jgi:hypothetical protein